MLGAWHLLNELQILLLLIFISRAPLSMSPILQMKKLDYTKENAFPGVTPWGEHPQPIWHPGQAHRDTPNPWHTQQVPCASELLPLCTAAAGTLALLLADVPTGIVHRSSLVHFWAFLDHHYTAYISFLICVFWWKYYFLWLRPLLE